MISELIPEEKRKLNDLEYQLSQLESTSYNSSYGNSSSTGSGGISPSDIYEGLKEMEFRILELEKLADKESKTRREDYRRRIQQLKNSHSHIKSSLDLLIKKRYPNGYFEQRSALFNGAMDVEGGGYSQSQIDISSSIDRSSGMVNTYIELGQNTLTELLSQRERMKNVHRKVLDMLNYLGLSNSIMKSVENRDNFDRIIVYGGMIFIVCLLLFIWLFVKKR